MTPSPLIDEIRPRTTALAGAQPATPALAPSVIFVRPHAANVPPRNAPTRPANHRIPPAEVDFAQPLQSKLIDRGPAPTTESP